MALTALSIGASGLQANSTALDVIGQNLANVNTTGYKSQRVLFRDTMYQTLAAGTAPTANGGGTDPAQSGSGVQTGAIGSLFGQGSVTVTGRSLDAAIQGSGFFVLANGASTAYSRSGSFSVDAGGFLVDPNTGFRVQRSGSVGEGTATTPGFQVAGDQSVRVPFGVGSPGTPTTAVSYQGNIDSGLAVGGTATTAIQVYDSQNTPRALTVTFTKTAANTFSATAQIGGGTAAVTNTPVTFNQNGVLTSPATLTVSLTGIAGANDQTITLNLGTPGQPVGLTQFGSATTANAVTQDGTGFGTLNSVSFDQTGQVIGEFTNGQTIPIAQLAIAGFNNDNGLLRSGNNYFLSTPASGEPLIGPGGSGGLGTVQGGSLEGSNVDIVTELSQLIIAQRGFQVNAQTVTAANEALQQLSSLIQ